MPTSSVVRTFKIALALVTASLPASAQLVRSGFGANGVDILGAVGLFQADLGLLNPNQPGSVGTGRREINWDGVPANFAAPNNLPADFFNVNSPRGITLSTAGTGFQVSATAASGFPVEFGNIDPNYPTFFRAFSAERLFTPLGSNTTDVNFFIPGTSTPALTTGFGSVFSDVDLSNVTSLQFFGANNNSLGTFFAPAAAGNGTFSFLGVSFSEAIVSRVRITTGSVILAPGNIGTDVVVMDDWIFGEPRLAAAASTPDPGSTAILLGLGFVALFLAARAFRFRLLRTKLPAADATDAKSPDISD